MTTQLFKVNFWFKHGQDLDEADNKIFRNYLSRLVDCLAPYLRRYFFLYEDYPHCFLAVELADECFERHLVNIVEDLCYRPRFVSKVVVVSAHEEGNGEWFLDIMHMTCRTIFEVDLMTPMNNQPKKPKLHHLVHCIMDMIYGSRKEELSFYKKQLKWYSKSQGLRSRTR